MKRRSDNMLEALKVAAEGWAWLDGWVQGAKECAREKGLAETVCDGCSIAGCCRNPVLCTWLDALPIAVQLDDAGENSPEVREQLWALGEKQESAICSARPDGVKPEVHECYFLMRGRCSVYSKRPAICRVYYVFNTRDACRHYSEREDGLEPAVTVLDHTDAIDQAVEASMELALLLGDKGGAPLTRSLPTQVSVILSALTIKSESEMWRQIFTNCRMPPHRIRQMIKAWDKKQPMKRRTINSLRDLDGITAGSKNSD